MNFNSINNVYLIGAGGIGVSSLARYFNRLGKKVYGYDRTQTRLTDELLKEGISIHFEDSVENIPAEILDPENKKYTIIIRTAAIGSENKEYLYFKNNKYKLLKRAEVLGIIANDKKGLAVAGTHGKTTITTCLAHLLHKSHIGCSAFLGGISKNYESNLIVSETSDLIVVEADEFDRSFLQLKPYMALISSIDADHLDIYGNLETLYESFISFAGQVKNGGKLIIKKNLLQFDQLPEGVNIYTYSLKEKADFFVDNLVLHQGDYCFDLITPFGKLNSLKMKLPGLINIENAIAACAMAILAGVGFDEIRESLKDFTGIYRRFDVRVKTEKYIYIDDYAHHPKEIEAIINSVRELYPGKKITAVFQPHLYSRTRDFAAEFATSLDKLDRLLLLELYPAREKPMAGVDSKIIFNKMKLLNKSLCLKKNLLGILDKERPEILLTIGAGDIGMLAGSIEDLIKSM